MSRDNINPAKGILYDDYSGEYYDMEQTMSFNSLLIPFLAKLTYRPNNFLIAVFGGIYFSVPLGEMDVYEEYSYYRYYLDDWAGTTEFELSAGFAKLIRTLDILSFG